MTRNQRLAFGVARSHGSKVQKFNFRANFERIYISMPIMPMDFYCLSETPPYDLSKTMKVPMGYCWHFLL